MRYGGEKKIPDTFSEQERKDIEEIIRELEHQFAMVEEFGEDALKVWRRINEERGYNKGKCLKEKYGIEDKDIEAVKKLIEAYLGDEPERTSKPEIRLEGEELIITSRGFCPLIESVKILDIDMFKTCPYSTRPYFLAMCRAVNPNVKHRNAKWRTKGDEVCQEIFWIEG